MVTRKEIPLLMLMFFTLLYSTIGDPNSALWSGLYFLVNYITMWCLFKGHKSKVIRLTGIALSFSIIIFIVLKYFLNLEIDRIYTWIPFLISLTGLIFLEHAPNNRKDL